MQTFLPYPDFKESAAVLDYRRLGKQRSETLQILKAIKLRGTTTKYWTNHIVTRMWEPYFNALVMYGVNICDEWISRGYKDNTKSKIIDMFDELTPIKLPPWIGDEKLHNSYKSLLKFKKFDYYNKYWKDIEPCEHCYYPIK